MKETIDRNEQVYWVCPLIEESEKIDLRDITEAHAWLKRAVVRRLLDQLVRRQDVTHRAKAYTTSRPRARKRLVLRYASHIGSMRVGLAICGGSWVQMRGCA